MLDPALPNGPSARNVQRLEHEVIYRRKLQDICNRINAARNIDEILVHLRDEIVTLFEARRITIYVVDGPRKELFSRFKSGDEIAEIRIPISTASIAGFSAFRQRMVNVSDCYDAANLLAIDPALRFDRSWDRKTGFVTRQVLACPIIHQNFLLGVIQLMNRSNNQAFSDVDERSLQELAGILGIALYNQKRMALARPGKFDDLIDQNLITRRELERAIVESRQRKEPIESILMRQFKIDKKQILRSLSRFYNLPPVEFSPGFVIPEALIARVKPAFLRTNVWAPLYFQNEHVVIAIDNPRDLQKIDMIKSIFTTEPIQFRVALEEDIYRFIALFVRDEKDGSGIDEILSRLQADVLENEETDAGIGEEDSVVVQLANQIILDAYARNASDIHIEPYPGKENIQVRFRIDGQCQTYQVIPYHYRSALVSRIKIMAELNIAERRKPQDGKIRFRQYGGKNIELRVATVPTQGGMEDVVMRILDAGEPIPLNQMGFSRRNHENFIRAITKPYGIIFVCGPTGSGKTTTLHSALNYINKVETKIWTAEDPVEITQRGLRQVQVAPRIGFDFSAAMRAFLRADPDVIMVGEMRDRQTTQIGIEASLTGHLVFSTLHTNSAPESVSRLLDMGMDPFNFADAILCILAQRLVLTLCSACKKPYHPGRDAYDELVREYGQEAFDRNIGIPYSSDLVLYRPEGCAVCNHTGYKGRMGIHELLMGTDAVKRLIQTRARMEQIRDQAIADGMCTLKQDGIEKVFAGHCNLLQVRKVCIK